MITRRKETTQKRLKELLSFDPCKGIFTWKPGNLRPRVTPGKEAGWKKKDGYVQLCVDQVTYYAHVLAWMYVYGKWPEEINHIDNNKSNNSIWNLEDTSHSENMIHYYISRS